MSVSTYIISYNHQIYARVQPWFARFASEDDTDVDLKTYENHAVAIGYDEITEQALPILEAEYGQVVVIDRQTDHIEELEADGRYDALYGDFRHGEIRKAANLKGASFVLSSTVQTEVNKALLSEVNGDAITFLEAEGIADARELYDRGATYVIMSTHLAADQLSDYLEAYFSDRDRFETLTGRDLERITSGVGDGERGPSTPPGFDPRGSAGGGNDD